MWCSESQSECEVSASKATFIPQFSITSISHTVAFDYDDSHMPGWQTESHQSPSLGVLPVDAEHSQLSIHYDAWGIYPPPLAGKCYQHPLCRRLLKMSPHHLGTLMYKRRLSIILNIWRCMWLQSVIRWLALMQHSGQTKAGDQH